MLRSQAQAVYAAENLGHFGLNLRRYAHFTSPIRRYADLIVHRALITACRLGADGLAAEVSLGELAQVGEQISAAERRAMAAERETIDRLIAHHLADQVGATFEGQIAGVTRAGLFIKLDETGADGFVPISQLGADYFRHEEARHALVGERSGETFRLGDRVEVRLVEAAPVAGALRFELLSEGRDPLRRPQGRRRPEARRPPVQGRAVRAPRRHPQLRDAPSRRAPVTRQMESPAMTAEATPVRTRLIPALARGFIGRWPALRPGAGSSGASSRCGRNARPAGWNCTTTGPTTCRPTW